MLIRILKNNHQYRLIECSFAITATGEPYQPILTINAMNRSRLQIIHGTETQNVTVIVTSTKKQVNNSVCRISSLEVYRGREQAIEIGHDGFSLGNSGTIEVNNHCIN